MKFFAFPLPPSLRVFCSGRLGDFRKFYFCPQMMSFDLKHSLKKLQIFAEIPNLPLFSCKIGKDTSLDVCAVTQPFIPIGRVCSKICMSGHSKKSWLQLRLHWYWRTRLDFKISHTTKHWASIRSWVRFSPWCGNKRRVTPCTNIFTWLNNTKIFHFL